MKAKTITKLTPFRIRLPEIMITAALLISPGLLAQNTAIIRLLKPASIVQPLESVNIYCNGPGTLSVVDAGGREYWRTEAKELSEVVVAGRTGMHKAILLDKRGTVLDSVFFRVEAKSSIEDGGKAGEFRLFY
jgi:hypothetical protein